LLAPQNRFALLLISLSLSGFYRIGKRVQLLDLLHFLNANRYPLRWKMLSKALTFPGPCPREIDLSAIQGRTQPDPDDLRIVTTAGSDRAEIPLAPSRGHE